MKKYAIFYYDKYYLLPESYSSTNEFIRSISNTRTLTLDCLQEKNCMAPFFSKESIQKTTVTIDPSKGIFPVEVNIYPQSEYDKLLTKQVDKNCHDCLNFVNDDEELDLTTHYDELSLDGVCLRKYKNKSEQYYKIGYYFDDLIHDFQRKQQEIEGFVSKKQFDNAEKVLLDIISEYMPKPISAHFKKSFGKYTCAIPSYNEDEWAILFHFLCKQLNDAKIKNWKFLNYLPKKFIKKLNKPLPEIGYYEENGEKFLKFVLAGKTNSDYWNAYLHLANEFGEIELLNGISRARFSFSEKRDGDSPYEKISPRRLAEFLKSENISKKDLMGIPVTYQFSMEDGFVIMRSDLFFDAAKDMNSIFSPSSESVWKKLYSSLGIAVAKIKIHISGNPLEEYKLLISNLNFKDDSVVFATKLNDDTFEIYLLVFKDEPFKYKLRHLSPVFYKYPATLELADKLGVITYRLGFSFLTLNEIKYDIPEEK